MTHTYAISGMTCSGCAAKVGKLLKEVKGVEKVDVDLAKGEAVVEGHVEAGALRAALKDHPKYVLGGIVGGDEATVAASSPWWVTYKPILLLFGYIGTIALVSAGHGADWMRVFMSGFFLSFSFFKLLDLRAFAGSYAMYDIVARRWAGWGYCYAFIELGLGIVFAMGIFPLYANLVTLVVMGVSIIGVLQSVLNKRKIKCACLGAVFNLPMSTVTIIEDALMIGMSIGGIGLHITVI